MTRRKSATEALVEEFELVVRKKALASGPNQIEIASILYEQAREDLLSKIRSMENTIARFSHEGQ